MTTPTTAAGRALLATLRSFVDMEQGHPYWLYHGGPDAILAIEAEARARVLDDPVFRRAVDEVFAAPGAFGPAKGYYGGDVDHFIDMLRAAIDALRERDGER